MAKHGPRTCCDASAPGPHKHTCANHTYRKNLKTCPFCGHAAEMLPQEPLVRGLKHWLVRCTRCQAKMSVFSNYITQARAEWNYRYTESTTKAGE